MNRSVRLPHFEKAVYRSAKTALRADAELWKEYRRRTSWRTRLRQNGDSSHARWLVLVIVPAVYFGTWAGEAHRDRILAIVFTLYTFGTVFNRADVLRTRLKDSLLRMMMLQYPQPDRDFFRWQVRESFLGTLAIPALWLFAFAVLASGRGFSWPEAFLYSLLQWSLSLVAIIAIYMRPLGRFPFGFALVTSACVAAASADFRGLIEPLAKFSPFGWLVLSTGILGPPPVPSGLLVTAVVLLAAPLPLLFASLRNGYSSSDIEFMPFSTEGPDAAQAEGPVAPDTLAAEFKPNLFQAGLMENLFRRTLSSQRELDVADFMVGHTDVGWWSKRLLRGALAALILSAASFAKLVPTALLIVAFVGLCFYIMPLAGGRWMGFSRMRIFNVQIPLHAVYPLSYREFSSIFMKAHVVRILAASPVVAAVSLSLASRAGISLSTAGWWIWQGLFFLVALQPTYVVMRVADQTSGPRSWPRFLNSVILLILWLALLAAGIASFFVPIEWRILLEFLVALCSYLAWVAFGRFFDRHRLDLMRIPTDLQTSSG